MSNHNIKKMAINFQNQHKGPVCLAKIKVRRANIVGKYL